MPNTELVDIFGRRRRHPEKRVDCAAKRERKRKPNVRAMIKNAENDGKEGERRDRGGGWNCVADVWRGAD